MNTNQCVAEFVQSIRRRNIRETVAALIVTVLFGFRFLQQPAAGLSAAGNLILALAGVWIIIVTWARLHIPAAELRAWPPAEHPDRWAEHFTRQAAMLRLAWLWYVAPFAAGLIIRIAAGEDRLATRHVVEIAIVTLIAAGIGALNVSAARRVEQDRQKCLS